MGRGRPVVLVGRSSISAVTGLEPACSPELPARDWLVVRHRPHRQPTWLGAFWRGLTAAVTADAPLAMDESVTVSWIRSGHVIYEHWAEAAVALAAFHEFTVRVEHSNVGEVLAWARAAG